MVASKIKTGSVPMDNELARTEEGVGGGTKWDFWARIVRKKNKKGER